MMDRAGKNLHAGNPACADFGGVAIGGSELAALDSHSGKLVRETLGRVVTRPQRFLRFRGESLPKLFVARRHKKT
jgi:hypothetical protein